MQRARVDERQKLVSSPELHQLLKLTPVPERTSLFSLSAMIVGMMMLGVRDGGRRRSKVLLLSLVDSKPAPPASVPTFRAGSIKRP